MTITSFLSAAIRRGRVAMLAMALVCCAFVLWMKPVYAQAVPPVSDSLAGSDEYQAQVQDDKYRCDHPNKTAYNNGQQQLLMTLMARNEGFYKYSVSAAYAAMCTGKMLTYAKAVYDAISKMGSMGAAVDVLTAALELVITQVLDAVIENLINQLNNEICAVTNELLSFAKSIEHNALCLPTGSISPFKFSPLNLNLPNDTCSGIAINPLGLINLANGTTQADLYTSSGLSLAGTALDPNTTIGGSVGTAIMGSTVGGFGNYSTGGMGNTPRFRLDDNYYDSVEYGDYVPTASNDTGAPKINSASNITCTTGSQGGYEGYAAKTAQLESGGCRNPVTCTTPSGSYVGQYQQGIATICTLGYCTCSGSECYGNNWGKVTWTGKNGVNSYNDLMNDSIQDLLFKQETSWIQTQIRRLNLTQYIGTTMCGVYLTDAGITAAIHLLGTGTIQKALQSGNCGSVDGFGTSWLSRAKALGCYNF